jgi:hypothetical protein
MPQGRRGAKEMRLWEVTTMMHQVFRIAAPTDVEALEIFHRCFPVEKEIRALNDTGNIYCKGYERIK